MVAGSLRHRAGFWAGLAACLVLALAAEKAKAADLDNGQWAVILEGFFPGQFRGGELKRLNVYMMRRGGQWVSALATATNNGKPNWNTALMPVDASKAVVRDGKLSGTLSITLAPDPWVPKDQKARVATVQVQATAGAAAAADSVASLSGSWQASIEGNPAELAEALLQGSGQGKILGGVIIRNPVDLADASYELAIYGLLPGQAKENFHRRRALSIGVKEGKVVSVRFAQMDMRHNAYDHELIETPADFKVTIDGLNGTVSFTTDTLDGEPARFTLALTGQRVHDFVAGTWKGTYTIGDKQTPIEGFLRGTVKKGAFVSDMAVDKRPFFVPVADFKPLSAEEHPRLFFRKSDLPELRRRAQTPEGQRIIKRLRELLNGTDGESMPTLFNPAKEAYERNNFKARPGAYSISHGAGFGFLYQLTGDRKYADLARQCVEKAFAGQRNHDDRYSWIAPGGELRAGPSVGWTSVAYDLCYEAWEPEFRQKVALAIQNYADGKGGEWNKAEGITLRGMALTPKQGPGSNHYGAVVGGSGLAVLAIKDDPGTDKELLNKYVDVLERQVVRHITAGWGDGGYYKEGWGASNVGTQGGFLCFLQALKVARGHDYLNVERPNASFITMIRAMMLVGPPAVYPYRSNMGGSYGSTEFHRERDGFSHGGHFSEGFGAIADRYKPGWLWVYHHFIEPEEARRDFDTPSLYPHRAMLALVNWPTFAGIEEKNPGEAMPKVTRDHLYEYFVFRNRWQDKDDMVTTVLINLPDGTRPRTVMVWGLNTRNEMGEPQRGAKVSHFVAGKDGSGVLTAGSFAMAVDYSKASGADGLVVTVGASGAKPPKDGSKVRLSTVSAGGVEYTVMTLSSTGTHPEAKAEGTGLVVGGQTVVFAEGKLILGEFEAAK